MNDYLIAPATRKIGDVSCGRIVQIAQWFTEPLQLEVLDSQPDAELAGSECQPRQKIRTLQLLTALFDIMTSHYLEMEICDMKQIYLEMEICDMKQIYLRSIPKGMASFKKNKKMAHILKLIFILTVK